MAQRGNVSLGVDFQMSVGKKELVRKTRWKKESFVPLQLQLQVIILVSDIKWFFVLFFQRCGVLRFGGTSLSCWQFGLTSVFHYQHVYVDDMCDLIASFRLSSISARQWDATNRNLVFGFYTSHIL